MDIIKELQLLKREHYSCEDRWYSCPLSEGGCADEYEPVECNCGADEINARIDAIILYVGRNDKTQAVSL